MNQIELREIDKKALNLVEHALVTIRYVARTKSALDDDIKYIMDIADSLHNSPRIIAEGLWHQLRMPRKNDNQN